MIHLVAVQIFFELQNFVRSPWHLSSIPMFRQCYGFRGIDANTKIHFSYIKVAQISRKLFQCQLEHVWTLSRKNNTMNTDKYVIKPFRSQLLERKKKQCCLSDSANNTSQSALALSPQKKTMLIYGLLMGYGIHSK